LHLSGASTRNGPPLQFPLTQHEEKNKIK
jgi:hypothetical protein